MINIVSGKKIDSKQVTWENGTIVNTAKTAMFVKSVDDETRYQYCLDVNNPGVDLTVKIYDVIDNVDYFVDWYTIGAGISRRINLSPIFCGTNTIKIVASNDTAVITAFTATLTIREVL